VLEIDGVTVAGMVLDSDRVVLEVKAWSTGISVLLLHFCPAEGK